TLQDARELMQSTNPLQPKSDQKQPRLTSEAVANDLRDTLQQYGLKDWKVEQTTDIISGVIVAASQKTIFVHAHAALEITRLAPIITHEIETHVLTTVNGAAQPLEIFKQGFAGYTRTQEGLASYNVEWRHPELFHRPARFWSRNAIAVDVALHGSFRDVYNHMVELGFIPHFAFGVAAKVKRGLIDTSKPGGFTKDYLYLAGRRDIMNFVGSGGDLRDLYIGKIFLDDLKILQDQPWLQPPKVLPRFLQEEQPANP
ncbi:MAG: tyrosine/phenylalanine carboxypeptidase domain-containing protein, partial [Parcubacteria group bacterium]